MESAMVGDQSVFRSFEKLADEPKEHVKAKEKDADIASLAADPRWAAVEEVIESMIDGLNRLDGISPEDTVEAVGFRFLASRTTISYLEAIKNMPAVILESQGEDEE